MIKPLKRAVFGANCYWASEVAFSGLSGVTNTVVGFMADGMCATCDQNPASCDQNARDKRQVEVVQVDFDSTVISYADVLETFWTCHNSAHPVLDPVDGKPSLERSVIFVCDEDQRAIAENACICAKASCCDISPITTTIETVGYFHRAADKDQQYLARNAQGVCSLKGSSEIE
jgi:peptide-methionine (S)-S-oxide reductase